MGFGWSFYGFFVAAAVWLPAVFRVGVGARPSAIVRRRGR